MTPIAHLVLSVGVQPPNRESDWVESSLNKGVNRHRELGKELVCPFRHPTIVNETLGTELQKTLLFPIFYASHSIPH